MLLIFFKFTFSCFADFAWKKEDESNNFNKQQNLLILKVYIANLLNIKEWDRYIYIKSRIYQKIRHCQLFSHNIL